MHYLTHNGFYVLLDDHTEDGTVTSSKPQFISKWVDLVTQLSQDPVTRQMLMVDILNEPDARGWGWDVMSVRKMPGLSGLINVLNTHYRMGNHNISLCRTFTCPSWMLSTL